MKKEEAGSKKRNGERRDVVVEKGPGKRRKVGKRLIDRWIKERGRGKEKKG